MSVGSAFEGIRRLAFRIHNHLEAFDEAISVDSSLPSPVARCFQVEGEISSAEESPDYL